MNEKFFESVAVGDKFETKQFKFEENAILDYCSKYDPQSFHLDRKEAAKSIFGGVVASGFHTLAIAFKLFMEEEPFGKSNMGGFAIDDVRLMKPVRGGDHIHVESEIVEARASESKPDRGIVRVAHDVVNQDGAVIAKFKVGHLVRRKPAQI
jgi:acyl dehydratase